MTDDVDDQRYQPDDERRRRSSGRAAPHPSPSAALGASPTVPIAPVADQPRMIRPVGEPDAVDQPGERPPHAGRIPRRLGIAPGSGPGRPAGFAAPRSRQGGIRREKAASDRLSRVSWGRAHLGSLRIRAGRRAPWGSGFAGIPLQRPLTPGAGMLPYERRNPSDHRRKPRLGRPSVGVFLARVPRLQRTACA